MKQPITLCMIVKDEAHVIERALTRAKPYITGYVIVDTGSTDGTQDKIREVMGDFPGVIHEREWVHFGHNRDEALKLAREFCNEGYLLIHDADDWLEADEGFEWPELTADCYNMQIIDKETFWPRSQMFRADQPWRCQGPVHEIYVREDRPTGGARIMDLTTAMRMQIGQDGNRRKNLTSREKYLADAKLLQDYIHEDTNPRWVYYLAQSYHDAWEREKAITYYQQRMNLGGFEEERWMSCYKIGLIYKSTGDDDDEARRYLVRAYRMRPHRMEPCVALAELYLRRKEWALARVWAEVAASANSASWKGDLLFADAAAHAGWRAQEPLGLAYFYLGEHEQARVVFEKMLGMRMPRAEMMRTRKNYVLAGGTFDDPFPIPTETALENLQPLRESYCKEVSNDAWALSLEAGAMLKTLVARESIKSVLDLGSGFSSAVLRTCPDLKSIVSVETEQEWSDKTYGFLNTMGPGDGHKIVLLEDLDLGDQEFDLVILDMAETTTRAEFLPLAWKHLRAGGYLYVDDMHHWPFNEQVDAFVASTAAQRLDVSQVTRDHFGRYGLLVKKG